MGALPATGYEFARWRLGVKVNIDYHVDLDRHYYSVPHQLVGRRVDVRATATTVLQANRSGDYRNATLIQNRKRPISHSHHLDRPFAGVPMPPRTWPPRSRIT
jgi:hypothetical protein